MAKNQISKPFQENFLDELIKKAGFTTEEGEVIKDDLKPILQERIILSIYRELDEKQVDKVGKFFEQNKYDELTKFLKKVIPNFDDFIMEVYALFEDEYLENFR